MSWRAGFLRIGSQVRILFAVGLCIACSCKYVVHSVAGEA